MKSSTMPGLCEHTATNELSFFLVVPLGDCILKTDQNHKENSHGKLEKKTVGVQGQDRFHASTCWALHKEGSCNSTGLGFEEGFSQRSSLRHADAHILHQSRGPWPQSGAPRRTGKSEGFAGKTDRAWQAIERQKGGLTKPPRNEGSGTQGSGGTFLTYVTVNP